MSTEMDALQERMRVFALGLPEAEEHHPWDHIAVKVRKKNFVFLGGHAGATGMFSMTVKLPTSSDMAVTLPYVEPAGYGLGRSGWVTVKCDAADKPDPDMFEEWILQSYRAVAPKKLSQLVA